MYLVAKLVWFQNDDHSIGDVLEPICEIEQQPLFIPLVKLMVIVNECVAGQKTTPER